MTIETKPAPVVYPGDDSTISWAIPWRVLAAGEVRVQLRTAAGDLSTLALGTDYTLAGVGASSASFSLVSIVPATGDSVLVEPYVSAVQTVDLADNDSFSVETIETALDRLTTLAAMLEARIGRALAFSAFSSGVDPTLPTPAAGKALGWNATADGFANVEAESIALADGAVTTAKLGAAAVTNDKIADATIQTAKLAASVLTSTWAANVDAAGYELQAAALKASREVVAAAGFAAGVLTANFANGSIQTVTLTANATTVTLSGFVAGKWSGGLLFIKQDGTGSRVATWPAAVKWPENTAPTLSTAAGAVDVVSLTSFDGGTTIAGALVAAGYTGLAFS
ncbi:MAG TPA: hypothetical protein P5558_21670 [Geminicoccaceae bacterium]|nr:hypothetical protein [Geminicoccaceae bacterium]HRY26991.1 hypothetical protein [Geminicoccaceae bacterium]